MEGLETRGAAHQEFSAEHNEQVVNAFARATEKLVTKRMDYENQGLSPKEIHDNLVEDRATFAAALEALEV